MRSFARIEPSSRAALIVWAGAATLVAFMAAPAAATALLSSQVPDAVATAPRVASASPTTRLHLSVSLPLRDEAGLDAFLKDIYDRLSPNYRHYLSVADFTARFGPSAADYKQAADFFRARGLTVTADAANNMLLEIDGSVGDIERVFHVKLDYYRHPTEARVFLAPDREPTVDLAIPLLHVTGLDDFQRPEPRVLRQTATRATGSGPGGAFIGSDARAAYYGGGALDGSGQSLGLMELAGYNISDVETYFTKFGPPLTSSVVGISTDGASLTCTGKCDDSEQVLDIEYSIAMAPGLKQVQVYVGKNAEDVLSRMASDNTSLQLSTSWGWSVKEFATDEPLLKEMAAQGQSFLTASGDYSSLQASGPWPEESADLTGVGGTDLVTKKAGGAWSVETGWPHSAGGPSLDKAITIPSYQLPFINGANGGSKTLRNVPDIAAVASNLYICADGKCNGGWGGTSFASPIWTGLIALANQRAAAEGKPPVGFLNPTFYALAGGAKYASAMHDILSGTSGKYSCTPSYDLVTGLGSPVGETLVGLLADGLK
jgi:subtilase family serine protease